MSQENTPQGKELIFDFKIEVDEIDASKARAFRTLCQIAFGDREASPAETALILSHLHYVLRHKMSCWYSIWTPEDVIEYADSGRMAFTPTIDQAKDVCHNLEQYEHIYSDISEAVKNEIETLRNSGVNE